MIFKIEREDMEDNKFINLIRTLADYVKKIVIFCLPIFKSKFNEIKVVINSNNELKKRLYYGLILAMIILLSISFGRAVYIITVFALMCAMFFELLKIISNIEQKNNELFKIFRCWGLVYIALFCISLILIRSSQQGLKISLWMFITIWSVDSIAYIFGRKIGKLKLAPTISPNKTYEGAIIGSIGGLFVSMVIYNFFSTSRINSFSSISFVIFSMIIIILAQLGDLGESYIKRQCGVKDSGNIIPGHGGVLDRFDSFLIAAPFILIIIWLNGGFLF